jgi:hypothetical protein
VWSIIFRGETKMRNHGLHPRLRTLTGYDGIQCEVLDLFSRLAADLSPENLTCDGELPRSQVNARLRDLQKKWKALESFVGRPVSEEEVWKHLQTQETELQAELDKLVEIKLADGAAQPQINGTKGGNGRGGLYRRDMLGRLAIPGENRGCWGTPSYQATSGAISFCSR